MFYVLTNVISSARVAFRFYRQSQDIDCFLQSNGSVSRNNYIRILALASIDVFITLPVGIAIIVLQVTQTLAQGPMPFYFGWTYGHTDWEPVGYSYAETAAAGTPAVVEAYFIKWTSPFLAFVIFGLFGATSEARASYWSVIYRLAGLFGWRPNQTQTAVGTMEFDAPMQNGTLDVEMG